MEHRPHISGSITQGYKVACTDCENRTPDCHGTCTRYKALKLAIERNKRIKATAEARRDDIENYERSRTTRLKHRRGM